MDLLTLDDGGTLSLQRFRKDNIPPYAILSHTWGQGDDEEVMYNDIKVGVDGNKPGYRKLLFCGEQAKHDGLNHFWQAGKGSRTGHQYYVNNTQERPATT
jgi:hypothetical protein